MPRRKPTSTKQKKAEQQLKRAIKRGDAPPPEPTKKQPRKKKGRIGASAATSNAADIEKVKRLQSAFVKVSAEFLEETRQLASNIVLPRPIPRENTTLRLGDTSNQVEVDRGAWSCPRRPKWRSEMTKLEVEKNEEGWFKKWLIESDERVDAWVKHQDERRKADGREQSSMPASITHYERNLEVWRQLWRTTERAQILLVLLDSRCPTLHYPPSLAAYLEHLKKKVILVLTKVDISGPERVEAWVAFLRERYPNVPIVQVESYAEKEITAVHQGRRQHEPAIPHAFRQNLIAAIKQVHSELATPSERIQSDPEGLRNWIPPVKQTIDWDALLEARGDLVGLHVNPKVKVDGTSDSDSESEIALDKRHLEYLTVGLIGQPNVGKSSLLNALFGAKRVRASKTPGKTKHLQTLFWTPDVLLVDCPGLVMPNYVPTELQVLSGVLPISRVSAVLSCVHFASQVLPLEKILGLTHPSLSAPAPDDKRTWRDGTRPQAASISKDPTWTAADILTAYANANGWVTAKAGRPDIHRAGNAVLRALAEGRIQWAFWPENASPTHALEASEDLGIWIPRASSLQEGPESENEDEGNHDTDPETEQDEGVETGTEDEGEDEEGEEDEGDSAFDAAPRSGGAVGRFGALALETPEEEESDASGA
ncbi:GTPase [Coprinopsis sp. MPI-PUGE-AT-0042]|nr:GTPase [Coprinopsis sp. MPI-PUGE-AT-0042]